MEVVGVVLGAVALAGPTYKLYKNCSQLVSDVRKYEPGLNKCCNGIAVQKGIYANTWILALSLVEVEEGLATAMLDDENHRQWNDQDFQKLWAKALGECFDAGVRAIRGTLKDIEEILSKVRRCRGGAKQDSVFKASKAAADKGLKRVAWSIKWKADLATLIDTLREQNQDLKNIGDQRDASQRAWKPKFRELKSHRDPDLMLVRLLAIREVSKTLYDSLAKMSTCSCHRVNLRLQFDVGETPDPISDPKLPPPISQTSSSPPVIIPNTKFRLIVTKEENRDGPISQPIGGCSGVCIVITSEVEPEENGTGVLQLKRRVTFESQNDGLPRKRVRFADSQVIETSSPWAVVVTVDGGGGVKEGRVLDLEPELETKRLKVTPKFDPQLAASDGTREFMIATPMPNLPANPAILKASMTPRNPTEIESLCSLMQGLAPESPANHCLGRVKSSNTVRRHFIYCDQPSILSTTRESLEAILASDKTCLYRDDRLRISLTLSKSLLHLGSFSRSFFQERWRSRDIFFFKALRNPSLSDTVGDPCVVPIFDNAANSLEYEAEGSDEIQESPARSEQLFSLALTLIEIGFGKRLWKIPTRSKIPEKADSIAEFMKARDILNSTLLEREMGVMFDQVVKRCFYCDFGIDEGDLCKKELQDIFYKKVVVPLEHCLEKHLNR